jgi:hypothetical protein
VQTFVGPVLRGERFYMPLTLCVDLGREWGKETEIDPAACVQNIILRLGKKKKKKKKKN